MFCIACNFEAMNSSVLFLLLVCVSRLLARLKGTKITQPRSKLKITLVVLITEKGFALSPRQTYFLRYFKIVLLDRKS